MADRDLAKVSEKIGWGNFRAQLEFHESAAMEFKRHLADRALEDVAACANRRGRTLFVGVENNGEVLGVAHPEVEMRPIANTIASRLGLSPSISRRPVSARELIEVRAEPARGVVGLDGRYRAQVGSTNRHLSAEELGRFLLQRSGQGCDGLARAPELDRTASSASPRFTDLGRRRIADIGPDEPEPMLQNLGLLRAGRLTNAAESRPSIAPGASKWDRATTRKSTSPQRGNCSAPGARS